MYNKVRFLYIWFYSDEELTGYFPLLYFREALQRVIKAIVSAHLRVAKSASGSCCA